MSFWTGSEGKMKSTLTKGQRPIESQLYGSAQHPGAGGAFGNAADYWYSLLNNDPNSFNNLFTPEIRRFNQEIIPGLSEQFAGMGSGGLSSSGFRNSLNQAGVDLSERLAAMRENLRMQASQNLMGLGQQSLQPFQYYQPGSPGFLETAGPAIFGSALSAGVNAAVGNPSMGSPSMPKMGSSSPYGNQNNMNTSGNYGLPTFGGF